MAPLAEIRDLEPRDLGMAPLAEIRELDPRDLGMALLTEIRELDPRDLGTALSTLKRPVTGLETIYLVYCKSFYGFVSVPVAQWSSIA